jgi:two-component system chemotaxis response regulator CheY
MATNALIVDEANGVRTLFSRILRSLECVTFEAADGVEALGLLDTTDINLAVIEAEMSLLSGLDLLQAIRSTERHAHMTVVITTSGADQATVAEVVKFGAADCLTKPFDIEVIKARLERVIKNAVAAGSTPVGLVQGPAGSTGTALIVDQNAEFRHFVANVLMSTYTTVQVESGLDALKACQHRRFTVLVMGSDTGTFGPRLLARRLRRQPELDAMRIVLVAPKDASRDVVDPTAFDAILTRTFVPDEFASQFQQVFARTATGGLGALEDVRRTVVSATEQAIGMMAHTEVSLVTDGSVTLPDRTMEAFTLMTLQMERAEVRMALRCDTASAVRVAAKMMGMADADVAPADGHSALGELVNVIAGRVKAQISTDGGSMSFTTPAMLVVDPAIETPAADLTLRFVSPDAALSLELRLSAVAAGEDA